MQVTMNKFHFTKLFFAACLLLGQLVFVSLDLVDMSSLNSKEVAYLASYIMCGVLSATALYVVARNITLTSNVMWLACVAALLVSAVDIGSQMLHQMHIQSGNPMFSFLDVRYKSSIIFIQTGRVALGLSILYQAVGQVVLAMSLLITLSLERALRK